MAQRLAAPRPCEAAESGPLHPATKRTPTYAPLRSRGRIQMTPPSARKRPERLPTSSPSLDPSRNQRHKLADILQTCHLTRAETNAERLLDFNHQLDVCE